MGYWAANAAQDMPKRVSTKREANCKNQAFVHVNLVNMC